MRKAGLIFLLWVLCLAPAHVGASTIFETTGWITPNNKGLVYEFTANETSPSYQVTLTDLSIAPQFGFDFLFVGISTSTTPINSLFLIDENNGIFDGQGSFVFDAVPGTKYFANVFGIGAGIFESGNFGLLVQSVPIPTSLLLLGSGLAGVLALRRKLNKTEPMTFE